MAENLNCTHRVLESVLSEITLTCIKRKSKKSPAKDFVIICSLHSPVVLAYLRGNLREVYFPL